MGPPATLINDLLIQFATGRAVAGPGQMACDRPSRGTVHIRCVRRLKDQFTFHMNYKVKEMQNPNNVFFNRSANIY